MKRILILLPVLTSLAVCDALDLLDINKQSKYISYQNITLSEDHPKHCSNEDVKKLYTLTEALATDTKLDRFYLNLCQPFYKTYKLEKHRIDRTKSISNIESKYQDLIFKYSNSLYINYFHLLGNLVENGKIYREPRNLPDMFNKKKDELSKFVLFYANRPKTSDGRKELIPFPKYLYEQGQHFLNVKSDFLFSNVVEIMMNYINQKKGKNLKESEVSELLDFLNKVIKLKENRGINPARDYFLIAQSLFNETLGEIHEYYKRSEILKNLITAYKYKKFPEEAELLNKILLKDLYLETKFSYKDSYTDLEEYEFIIGKLEEVKKLTNGISDKKYMYTVKIKAFLYLKLLYIENNPRNRSEAIHYLTLLKSFESKKILRQNIDIIIQKIIKRELI